MAKFSQRKNTRQLKSLEVCRYVKVDSTLRTINGRSVKNQHEMCVESMCDVGLPSE